jgi:hypothetical protein
MSETDPLTLQWMFQYNPTNYNLESSIERSLTEDWIAPKHKMKFRVGQRIYFMRSAAGKGIDTRRFTAVGRISSQIYEQYHPRTDMMRSVIDVVYDYLVVPNFDRPKIMADSDPDFSTYGPYVDGQFATAFPLPPGIAARTEYVLRGYLRPIGTSHRAVDKRVFVSYAREDIEFGTRLVRDLRQRLGGHDETVWFDMEGGLHGGDTFIETIEDEIRDRPVFIVIVSPDSMTSRWVNQEVSIALNIDLSDDSPGGKLIVPVLLRECRMRSALATRHGVPFQEPRSYDDALGELMSVINQQK